MPKPRSWTDDDLRMAVARSTTMTEVLTRLGLSKGGGTHVAVRGRIAELAIDTAHFVSPGPLVGHDWTDEMLRSAVSECLNLTQVLEKLGVTRGPRAYQVIGSRIAELGLNVSHWGVCARDKQSRRLEGSSRRQPSRRTWSDEQLAAVVPHCSSIAEVLRELRLKVGGGTYVSIREAIDRLELDTSHFTGKGWLKGRTNPHTRKRPLSEILVENSDYRSTPSLKRRLIQEGLKEERCEICGRIEWNGRPIPLQLDHINGDRTDNRLENLRIVCPNCHSQTDTWCGRNRGRYDGPSRDVLSRT